VRGLAKPSCVGAAGQSAAGTNVVVSVSEGGLAVITSANARKRRTVTPGFKEQSQVHLIHAPRRQHI
jgi:hypothetical protein